MNNKGYTLIELVVTISLVIIVTAIFVPKLNYNRSYLKSISHELLYDLRHLKTNSMTRDDATYKMVISENMYYITKSTSESITPTTIKLVEIDPDFELFSNNSNYIMFSYNGTPIYPTTIKITNKKTNEYKKITITVGIGRILLIE